MGPEQQRLMDRLFGDPTRKLLNFKITPGERRVTAEELCRELNKAFDDIESGQVKEAGPIDSGMPRVDVNEWLSGTISAEEKRARATALADARERAMRKQR